jgi:hypothetical protein
MLYSRFPAGSVGWALLLLRLVDGIGLIGEGIQLTTSVRTSSEPVSMLLLSLALGASAVLLILGLRTSWAGGAAAISAAGSALHARHYMNFTGVNLNGWFLLFALVFFLSSSLALLGPGGYSLDARLSGWQMIRIAAGQTNSSIRREG